MKEEDREEEESIKTRRERLPIFSHRDEILAAIEKTQILLVVGEAGNGKASQLPQYLVGMHLLQASYIFELLMTFRTEAGYAAQGRIACTQPRRVAVTTLAARVAEEVGCALGTDVGYSIRFKECTSPDTKIVYMSEATLLMVHFNQSSAYMAECNNRSNRTICMILASPNTR